MSDCMIIRRGGVTKGGGGGGFSHDGAVLKVITSTGCAVNVSGTGYDETQETGEGYGRSSDLAVTEHLFSIPASAFGDLTVTSSMLYSGQTLTNSKEVSVTEAGKVYELYISAPNIILDSTFGLQDGFTIAAPSIWKYSERYKRIERASRGNVIRLFNQAVNVTPYEHFTVNSEASYSGSGYVDLIDADNVTLGSCGFNGSGYHDETATIKDKYYPTAEIYTAYDLYNITKIVLS